MKNASLLAFLAIALSTTPAAADLLSLRAETRAGGAVGTGMFGERHEDAFHAGIGGPGYGVVVGAEVLLVDLWIEHNQYLTGGDVDGTWTQFMLGFDVQFDFGADKSFSYDENAKKIGGYPAWFGELGMGLGFGVGTGQQVDPPLDNTEVTDKGLMFEGRAAFGYRLTRLLSLGMTFPLTMGYFTKSGAGTFANNVDNHYMSLGFSGLVTFRAKWQIK